MMNLQVSFKKHAEFLSTRCWQPCSVAMKKLYCRGLKRVKKQSQNPINLEVLRKLRAKSVQENSIVESSSIVTPRQHVLHA